MGDPTFSRSPPRVGDGFALKQGDDLDLTGLAEQLIAIAARLRGGGTAHGNNTPRLAAPVLISRSESHESGDGNNRRALYAGHARKLYATRRQRESIFADSELFGEPAWDILLDLYVAFADDKKVSVSSACIGSAAPSTTGLRWLGILADRGLIEREHDPDDQRRVLVQLSEAGLQAMDTYFASTISAG